ncbi:redox-sensitive transcriptional activator SoxR [Thermobifida fusca]|jgi:MerR family transcriptional regulator, redox-sensitive transcriptional activator SoxR|uniref:Redox-sensitive transcriptional activator SoxR n=2 Tax=Thermobifida fusca TaxID=2021 RepID=A0A9P2TBU2_THEFU|nr:MULTISPECIES: redox-sensitive transcriptional activator SoxR [Thermobifida]AAZ54446.1 redox-sensitive transcriptional activator SoxR [Thermobifida fusca YX]EOR72416.1 redox-sensitive transcriptional activator SoxR [Thermobifida fusca TM51]MBO2529692.1 redox-sensitive transcriptional activator SoxR [Thermobifida sp.]MDD6792986.1 redox-sensitive transcriptional activator SoxR [Thermobifida fusca]PPS95580.1 MerR family transcriptional regulator [Thermobifida fusca]
MAQLPVQLTIGQLAERSGMSHSALRFYEAKGLIRAERTAGNQRRYHRSTLRRLAFIAAAQRVGLTLARIQEALATLPEERAPTAEDWARLSRMWRDELETRIDALQRLRDRLTSCIGCGCLSLRSCALRNNDDALAAWGPGAPLLRPAREGGL